ncbi:conserved phage C-terminal domain-containing protein [Macrococcus bovicus]|uniref:Alpha/beta hydrolase n=1 Tax=Macrococcus bovicus TaxID=69968 RepID=A0A4R6BW96_9STAP|nr:conserved phage C-terminal domain-containing protein [Macrococcus bovicus]TDM12685.1 alpha/beta hydrolase [Macrococcus bovicus]
MTEQPSYYAILTANVRYDNRLTDSEKILFAEITALSNKYGYCTASNGYFAKLYNVHKITVSNRIANLKKLNYLRDEMIYEGKEIKQRKLYPLVDALTPINANANTPVSHTVNTPINANAKENITSINNTSNNISSSDARPHEEIINYLNEKTGKKFSHKTKQTVEFINGRLGEGKTIDDFKKVIDVKVDEWLNTDQDKHLNPSTLFRPANFEKYLNQKPSKKRKNNNINIKDKYDAFLEGWQ